VHVKIVLGDSCIRWHANTSQLRQSRQGVDIISLLGLLEEYLHGDTVLFTKGSICHEETRMFFSCHLDVSFINREYFMILFPSQPEHFTDLLVRTNPPSTLFPHCHVIPSDEFFYSSLASSQGERPK
jgi:hypothetical protein